MKASELDRETNTGVLCQLFTSLREIQPLMEFPVKVLSDFCSSAKNHHWATRIRPKGSDSGGQNNQQELVCGWKCQGMVKVGERKTREGGRAP